MELPQPRARVRLTDDAVADLQRLRKKDPQIVREVFKKMLLLERSPASGEPLLGELIGFRKLVVGDRDYRIVWRETVDEAFHPVLEIAEVWAVGARADSEVYSEMASRVHELKSSKAPNVQALIDVIESLSIGHAGGTARPEPEIEPALPRWLAEALESQLHLSEKEIQKLNEEDAKQLLVEHWSKPTF